jgi:hypothetical protein
VRFSYVLLDGRYDHNHVLKVAIFASTAAVLGIIYAGSDTNTTAASSPISTT